MTGGRYERAVAAIASAVGSWEPCYPLHPDGMFAKSMSARSASRRPRPEGGEPRLVVGVGASAGGLEAFKQLLGALPGDSGMTFLLVQHLDPHHKSVLAELLAPFTAMTVRDADQGLLLVPNTVFIIRPDTALAVKGGRIELSEPTGRRGVRLPVDHLFMSLAAEYGSRSVGIVLSGAGSDGSAGARHIKAEGGLIIAQDPRASGQPGMPQSVIDAGVVDLVLNIPEMPSALARFAALPSVPRAEQARPRDEGEERPAREAVLGEQVIGRLAAVLEAQMNFDLRVYKPATIARRMLRRMTLSDFQAVDPYLDYLRTHPEEQQTLVRDLLISVTEFFRDPDSFRSLRETVIDPMVASLAPGAALRAWVPGCATGEEAYSIAMEFLDAIESHDKRASLRVFATDVDQEALAVGRAAVYPPSIAEHVSDHRLQTYFKPLDGKGYQARPSLRDVVSFAVHDLTKDPPFSRMNLVSCRNVLIYLTQVAQRHVLQALHFALEPDGYLFLSTSESPGPQRELFSTLSKTHRIYRKLGHSLAINVSRSRARTPVGADVPRAASPVPARPAGSDLARRAVLDAIAPPTLVVSDDGSIVFAHGDLTPYVRIPEGDNPRFELGAVLRPEFATRVFGVLYKCRRNRQAEFALSSPDRSARRVRIGARPASALGLDWIVLTFEQLPDSAVVAVTGGGGSSNDDVVRQIEKELQATREDLRNTVEELETSNEDLRSAHEEAMSMNEELQSANEELEATTEELRSLNEELTTVNSQLREKVEQLEVAHDDLNNFFSSTNIATIFLDDRLCIKRFTPAAQELLAIDHSTSGRFVGDVARELLQNDLAADAKMVLQHLSARSTEVRTAAGRSITRRVLPYRTESRRIEGVVVTFNDVTELRDANLELNRRNRRLELAWEAARGGILEHRLPLDDSTYISPQWAHVLGYQREELPAGDQLLTWLPELAHPDDRERFDLAFSDLVEGRADRYALELRFRHKSGDWIWVRKIAKVLERDEHGRPLHLLRMMIDVSDLKKVEASLQETEERFRTLADNISQLVWTCDRLGQATWYNQRWFEFTGTTWEEMQGEGWSRVHHPDHLPRVVAGLEAALAAGEPWEDTFPLRGRDGNYRWFLSRAIPIRDRSGAIVRWFGTNTDITDLREVEDKLVKADRQKDEFLAMLGHELRNPLAAIRTASELIKVFAAGDPRMTQPRQVLERQTAHMAKLLDGLLDISRIIRGKIKLEPEVLDFGALCREVSTDVTGNLAPRSLEVRADIPAEPQWVRADRVRLAQIVSNLLANAVKYTPDGGSVRLTLGRDDGTALLKVQDTGVGIEADLLPDVFEIFRQANQSMDRAQGGLGLGLALVKTLVELHQGRVEASSEGPGKGAEFVVRLPLTDSPPGESSRPAQGAVGPRRILLIEDNLDAAEMLKEVLGRMGHQVTVATSGMGGLSAAREAVPDVILCDLGLPGGMSGFEVAKQVRSDGRLQAVGLVALSGYGRPEDKARSRESGFDAHLTKPVDVDEVQRVLAEMASASERRRETA